MGLFQKPAKPPGPAAVVACRRPFACAGRKKGRKLLKMREPGRNDMVAVSILYSLSAHVRDGELSGGGNGGGCRVRDRSRSSRYRSPKLKIGITLGTAPIGSKAKLNMVRRGLRA
jgi:hypothetical protein